MSCVADTRHGTTIDLPMVFVARKDTMTRTLPIVTLASLLAVGTPTAMSAQPVVTPVQWGQANPRGDYQRSFDDGYRSGLREGDRDARSGRRPDFRQHDEFRRGSTGWGWGRQQRSAQHGYVPARLCRGLPVRLRPIPRQ